MTLLSITLYSAGLLLSYLLMTPIPRKQDSLTERLQKWKHLLGEDAPDEVSLVYMPEPAKTVRERLEEML